ncbi:MAG: nitrous oxide reductase family maturation protein NosD [Phycisphaerales bacterium]|nr:nitrous oxide reductase family maturation protein NosD [Phycisphaerales bacterium]
MISPRTTPALFPAAAVWLLVSCHASAQSAGHEAPAPIAEGRAEPLGVVGRRIAAAAPGDTIVVGEGVYHEHLRIDKPVSLVAEGRVVLDGRGNGDVVVITAPDVTLRGFTIRNTGTDLDKENAGIRVTAARTTIEDNVLEDILFGIDLRESPDSRIARNRIGGKNLDIARRGDGLRLWRSDRTVIEENAIHDGRDAILWYSSGVTVRNNTGLRCRYGLHLMFSDNITITGNEFAENSVGIYLMYSTGVELVGNRLVRNRGPSGYGIGLKETDRFSVRGNLLTGNRAGVYIDGSPFTSAKPGEFTRNTIASNDVGMVFLPSARGNELAENNFIDNIDQVSVAGRGTLEANRFWKGDRGNFWSDYSGYDHDGDGVGDFVHEPGTLFENLMDKQPSLRLFLFSPAQQAIEFVGRAVPAIRPEPKFTDEVPLMRPVPIEPAAPADAGNRGGLALAGLAMVGIGLAALRAAASPRGDRLPRSSRTARPVGAHA